MKLRSTAKVSSNYSGFAPDYICDGDLSTRWAGQDLTANSHLVDFGGIKFNWISKPTSYRVRWANSGKVICIGTWPANVANPTISQLIPIHTHDTSTKRDKNGVAFAQGVSLTFDIDTTGFGDNGKIPGLIFWSLDNINGPLGSGGAANINQSVYEFEAWGDVYDAEGNRQIERAPFAGSTYGSEGPVANLADDNTANWWSGNNTFANSVNDYCGVMFPELSKVDFIQVKIFSWSRVIKICSVPTSAVPTDQSQLQVIRSIDTPSGAVDDYGQPIVRDVMLKFNIPAGTPKLWGIAIHHDMLQQYSPTLSLSNPLDRARVYELYAYEGQSAPVSGPFISQSAEQLLLKSASPANTQVTQSNELVLLKESEATNNLQVSHAAIVFVEDVPEPSTNITQASEQLLLKQGNADTQVSTSTEMIFARDAIADTRISNLDQMIFIAENPSLLWLDFGTLTNPVRNTIYESDIARATSVVEGTFIQLESPHYEGTTLIVNGEEMGLSAMLAEADEVSIKGGVTNYFQKEMNVYAYYFTNGEVTRELIGVWKIEQANLVPTKGRAYAEQYTNDKWIPSETNFSFMTYLSSVVSSVSSAVHSLTTFVSQAFTNLFSGGAQQAGKTGIGTKSLESQATQAHSELSEPVTWDLAKVDYADVSMESEKVSGTHVSDFNIDPVITHDGTKSYKNDVFETIVVGAANSDRGLLSGNPVGFGTTDQKYQYNQVNDSSSVDQTFFATLSTGFASTFEMTVRKSDVQHQEFVDHSYLRGVGEGTGAWLMPTGVVELAKAGFAYVGMGTADKVIGHSEVSDRDTFAHHAHDFHTFARSSMYRGFGISQYNVTSEKRVEHKETVVQDSWNRAIANLSNYRLVPERPTEATNSRGAASLYMGFDTLQDVLDYTEQYTGVSTLQMYNGYVYNLEIDKSFVCEIYFNGPISGLIQGG